MLSWKLINFSSVSLYIQYIYNLEKLRIWVLKMSKILLYVMALMYYIIIYYILYR